MGLGKVCYLYLYIIQKKKTHLNQKKTRLGKSGTARAFKKLLDSNLLPRQRFFSQPIYILASLLSDFFQLANPNLARTSPAKFLLHFLFNQGGINLSSTNSVSFEDVIKSMREELDGIFPEARGKIFFVNIQLDEFQVLPHIAIEIFKGFFDSQRARILHNHNLFVQFTFTGLDKFGIVNQMYPSSHTIYNIQLPPFKFQTDSMDFMKNALLKNPNIPKENLPEEIFESQNFLILLNQMGQVPRFLHYFATILENYLKISSWDRIPITAFDRISSEIVSMINEKYGISLWQNTLSEEGLFKILYHSVFKKEVLLFYSFYLMIFLSFNIQKK